MSGFQMPVGYPGYPHLGLSILWSRNAGERECTWYESKLASAETSGIRLLI